MKIKRIKQPTMSAEEILISKIRAINTEWDYGETPDDVFRQLWHFFDPPVAKRIVLSAMEEYASQQKAAPLPAAPDPEDFTVRGPYDQLDFDGSSYEDALSSASSASVNRAKCLDCGKPYDDFGLDMFLPHSQWMAIHPDKDGLLCAQCIVNRASKIEGVIVIHALIETKINGLSESPQEGEPKCKGCGHTNPADYSLRTTGYCYLCDGGEILLC